MVDLEKLDFSAQETRKKIQQEIAEGFYPHPAEMKKWHKIRGKMEEFLKSKGNLKETDPLVYEECLDLLNKAKWFSFVYLRSEDFINLFKHGLKYALVNRNYPLEKSVSVFLIDVPILSIRDDYKKRIREAMFVNEEKLTSEEIVIDGKEEEPTISNWLRFYDMELGAGEVERLKTMEILFKNENIIRLSSGDRQIIRRLIDLYEELKISALTVEGLEEEDYVVDENGEIELHRRNSVEQISRGFARLEQSGRILEEKTGIQEEKKAEALKKETPLIDVNQATKQVFQKIDLSFSDPELENRFKNIILSFFRDIRTAIETKIILKRETQVGGMGLNQEATDKIIDILKEFKPRIDQKQAKREQLIKISSLSGTLPLSPLPADNIERIAQIETRIQMPVVKPAEVKKEDVVSVPKPQVVEKQVLPVVSPRPEVKKEIPISPVLKQVPPPAPPVVKKETIEIKKEIKPEPQFSSPKVVSPMPNVPPAAVKEPVRIEIPIHRPFHGTNKPAVEEVKVKPRVYGPIDELRTITLADWRRWGLPKQAAKTIQDKINLLAEESLVKKAEGIKAWKESEINQLYLDIGAESIDQGKSVSEIISQRQTQNKFTLTEEEFNAVVELNQKLRF